MSEKALLKKKLILPVVIAINPEDPPIAANNFVSAPFVDIITNIT